MGKKLNTACMALVALAAFVLPAVASASLQITHPTGTRLATGVKIKATQIGASKFTSTSNTGAGSVLWECSAGSMTGELTKNNGAEIEANIEALSLSGTAAESKCTGLGGLKYTSNVGNGVPWCLRATNAMNADEFQIRGGKCNEAARPTTLLFDTGLGVNCSYERTTAIKGTYTTDSTGDAILTLTGSAETGISDTGFTREGTNALCPASTTLDTQFTLETDTETAQPLYIS